MRISTNCFLKEEAKINNLEVLIDGQCMKDLICKWSTEDVTPGAIMEPYEVIEHFLKGSEHFENKACVDIKLLQQSELNISRILCFVLSLLVQKILLARSDDVLKQMMQLDDIYQTEIKCLIEAVLKSNEFDSHEDDLHNLLTEKSSSVSTPEFEVKQIEDVSSPLVTYFKSPAVSQKVKMMKLEKKIKCLQEQAESYEVQFLDMNQTIQKYEKSLYEKGRKHEILQEIVSTTKKEKEYFEEKFQVLIQDSKIEIERLKKKIGELLGDQKEMDAKYKKTETDLYDALSRNERLQMRCNEERKKKGSVVLQFEKAVQISVSLKEVGTQMASLSTVENVDANVSFTENSLEELLQQAEFEAEVEHSTEAELEEEVFPWTRYLLIIFAIPAVILGVKILEKFKR